jgi:hypothetical protein
LVTGVGVPQISAVHQASLAESHPHDVQMTVEAPNYSGR